MSSEFSKDDAAVYDRQIRLWGLDAQQRIGKTNILVAGMRALGNEVCKNLALAGVASITLLDHETVTEFDLGAQFFLTEDKVGQNRAEAAVPAVRNLNPRVQIIVDKEDIAEKPDSFFESFQVVCLIHSNFEIMTRVDRLRRAIEKPYYAADTFGWFGYIFCDLTHHQYEVEVAKPISSNGSDKSNGSAEKSKKEKEKREEDYNSLEESLQKTWETARPKDLRRISPISFLVQILLKFQKENGRSPNKVDTEALINRKAQYLSDMGISNESLLDDDLLRELASLLDTEISPVAAIVGGILAQDILRTLSANELPIQNWFYFNGHDGSGSVHKICT